jgi:flagellar hook assembly protein FlgD
MSEVEIVIFDLLGREKRRWLLHSNSAGHHELHWDGSNDNGGKLSSGLYLYQLRVKDQVQTKKMMLLN